MTFNIRQKWIKKYLSKKGVDQNQHLVNAVSWADPERICDINVAKIGWDVLEQIAQVAENDAKTDSEAIRFIRRYKSTCALKNDPTGKKITSLKQMPEVIRVLMKDLPNKWVFSEDSRDGSIMPYFVEDVTYQPPRQDCASYVKIDLEYVRRGEKKSTQEIWHHHHIRGKTAPQALQDRGLFLETPEMVERYLVSAKRYVEIRGKTGMQFLATGVASTKKDRWSHGEISMIREGVPTRVLMDDIESDEDNEGTRSRTSHESDFTANLHFWECASGDDEDDNRDDAAMDDTYTPPEPQQIPRHPYVQMFDLQRHDFIEINTDFLEDYQYDDKLGEKLVIADDKRRLIEILVGSSEMMMDDIVKGKSGGIIVLASGPSGVGKSLSAEIFSEHIKRPLYNIQCSQLGTCADTLETQLKRVLSRSMRWNSILLMDEADVYVHERGNDLDQNAIVGVFLRTLEYYRGVMFMTTNRATIVDDAIMSRVTAWIKYDMPSREELSSIWRVLAKNYGVEVTPEEIADVVHAMPHLSGRNVKNILKLAKLYTQKSGGKITVKSLRYVANYLDIAENNSTERELDF